MKDTHERPVCHRAEDLVSYLYGEAGPTDALDFRNHLQQCDACRSEFTAFNQLHSSIQDWRNEALGASFEPAAAAVRASDATQFVRQERKLSALAALREFFTVSPVWLRGAIGFAALLLCVLAVMMIVTGSRKPAQIARIQKDEKLYNQKELDAEVKIALDKQAAEMSRKDSSNPVADKQERLTGRKNAQVAANRQPKSFRQRGLNRQEREQLAADLRLTLPADEEELPLVLPEQEHPNQ